MATWEYHVEQFSFAERWSVKRQAQELEAFTDRLNEMGALGWEMVSYESVPVTGGISGQHKGFAHLLFFKRKRSS